MDILTFLGQILLVPRNCKQAVITRYQETKATYKKSKKRDRKQSLTHSLLSSLHFDPYSYHRRNEFTKWLTKASHAKGNSD
jgi:hypothetical protein